MRLSSGVPALRSVMGFWIAIAHSTAATTEENSISSPSPVVLTMRPPLLTTSGAAASRCSRTARAVPASSSPMRREYPTTSAARIAASLRVSVIEFPKTGLILT